MSQKSQRIIPGPEGVYEQVGRPFQSKQSIDHGPYIKIMDIRPITLGTLEVQAATKGPDEGRVAGHQGGRPCPCSLAFGPLRRPEAPCSSIHIEMKSLPEGSLPRPLGAIRRLFGLGTAGALLALYDVWYLPIP